MEFTVMHDRNNKMLWKGEKDPTSSKTTADGEWIKQHRQNLYSQKIETAVNLLT